MVIQSDYNYISSKEFNKIISNPHDIFRFGQHDSLELFRILLEHISNENNKIKIKEEYEQFVYKNNNKKEMSEDFHNFYIKNENSFIIDIFYSQLINIYTCVYGYDTFSFQKNLDIPIYIPINNKEFELINLIKENFSDVINDWIEEYSS